MVYIYIYALKGLLYIGSQGPISVGPSRPVYSVQGAYLQVLNGMSVGSEGLMYRS